jgi:hypothetical protein
MNERLTVTQRMALSGASEEKRARIEEESSLWMVQCGHCGFEASVWDLGGVRYRARGTKTTRRRCPECGKRGVHKTYWAGTGDRRTDTVDAPVGRPLKPPVRPPAQGSPVGPLPVWLILVGLMGVGFLANELWGVALPVWLLVLVGFGLRGTRGVSAARETEAPVTATFTGGGCLMVLGLVLLGWILARGIFGSLANS